MKDEIIICRSCKGTGFVVDNKWRKPRMLTCLTCNGTGREVKTVGYTPYKDTDKTVNKRKD